MAGQEKGETQGYGLTFSRPRSSVATVPDANRVSRLQGAYYQLFQEAAEDPRGHGLQMDISPGVLLMLTQGHTADPMQVSDTHSIV